MDRIDVLKGAEKRLTGDRPESYGPPEDSLPIIAKYWSLYLQNAIVGFNDIAVSPLDAANMMVLLKIARQQAQTKIIPDNYIDMAGYSALAGEIATMYRPDEEGMRE